MACLILDTMWPTSLCTVDMTEDSFSLDQVDQVELKSVSLPHAHFFPCLLRVSSGEKRRRKRKRRKRRMVGGDERVGKQEMGKRKSLPKGKNGSS